jgi:hypothetical protein
MVKCLPATILLTLSILIGYHSGFAQLPPLMKYKVIVADEGNGKVHYINLTSPTERWSITTANRDLQLIGNDRLMVSVGDGYAEYNVKTGAFIKKITTGGTVQSVFRLTTKSTFIGCDGSPASILEADTTGKQIRKINLAVNASIRIVRPTLAKTFLVGGKVAGVMNECDSTGTIKWSAQVGGEPYMALRLANGNTLISNGYGVQMALVDSKSNVLKAFPTQADKSGSQSQFWTQALPNFFGGFQVLKNGNIVVANWEGHGAGNGGKGFQLIEIDSGLTKVVSYWKQDAALVSSLHGVLVIDSLDTKNMYSDVNGILAPVTQVAIRRNMLPGYVQTKSPAIPSGSLNLMFGLNGKSIPGFSLQSASGVYVRKTGKTGTAVLPLRSCYE